MELSEILYQEDVNNLYVDFNFALFQFRFSAVIILYF